MKRIVGSAHLDLVPQSRPVYGAAGKKEGFNRLVPLYGLDVVP